MNEILHSFAIGIAFALGILTGGTLSALLAKYVLKTTATRQDRWSEHLKIAEERLGRSADAQERIADTLESMEEDLMIIATHNKNEQNN